MRHADISGAQAVHQSAYVQETDPGAVGAFKAWVDLSTTPAGYKVRNATNTGWILTGASVTQRELVDVHPVASEVEQLALVVQEGDVAIRSDLSRSFVHNGGTTGTMADWLELLTPPDSPHALLSVSHTDVNAADVPAGGEVLTWDATAGKWVSAPLPAPGASALNDLSDATITTPSTGQVLKFNGTEWVNAADETGGGTTDAYSPTNKPRLVDSMTGGFTTTHFATDDTPVANPSTGRLGYMSFRATEVTRIQGMRLHATILDATYEVGLINGNLTWSVVKSVIGTGAAMDVYFDTPFDMPAATTFYPAVQAGVAANLHPADSNFVAMPVGFSLPDGDKVYYYSYLPSGDYLTQVAGQRLNISLIHGSTSSPAGDKGVVGPLDPADLSESPLDALSNVTLATPASGEVLTFNGTEWVNAAGGGSGGTAGVASAFGAYQATAQRTILNDWLKLIFGAEEYDEQGEYDPVAGTFTAKAAGDYAISASVHLLNAVDGTRGVLSIMVNGIETYRGFDQFIGAAGNFSPSLSTVLRLVAGDVVDIRVYTSMAMDTYAGTAPKVTTFRAVRVPAPSGGATAPEDWHEIGAVGEPAFQNGWVNWNDGSADPNFATAAFYKDSDNRVHLKGRVKNGTVARGGTGVIWNLPLGYRSALHEDHIGAENSGILITAGGDVMAASGSATSFNLNGISFRAA